ncbi:MAG: uroporphyrinogen-III C-methyltransferase [Kangiellaceae bacterium]|nr:uroporphyrinogen-III C-methyltransferase [Kangiellaceae bacterium]
MKNNQDSKTNKVMRQTTVSAKTNRPALPGVVYLVGAGPGDPDLLTVKAVRVIKDCDVILYDNLVSQEIHDLFPVGVKKFFVGKSNANHSIPQGELNQLMVTLAKKGLNICRIKGGDPFIFGRGSEEMLVLKKCGIETQVVPGITAASGCSSYAGIPLTHRGVSQGCTFITAHSGKSSAVNWDSLANSKTTLVFYMGLARLNEISQSLIENGMNRNMPTALIENGCQVSQRVFTTELSQLAAVADREELESPTLVVVGEVVNFRQDLAWFESLSNEEVADESMIRNRSTSAIKPFARVAY